MKGNTMTIEDRIQAAIKPVLDRAEELFTEYAPKVIGKHHPLYDSPLGRNHHYKRKNSRGGYFIIYHDASCWDRPS